MAKYLVPVLAVTAMLTGGIGAAYAGSQDAGDDPAKPGDSMMGSGGMGSMGSMMESGGASEMQGMGQFSEEKPFDLQFIDQMTLHHEGAIMSSKHMISDSKRPELRKLAENIEESQSEQIDQMREWRDEWYPDAKQSSGMLAGMMGGSMQEMMGCDATDEMFLRMMIPHHQMAVDMAEKALDEAEHPELENLAKTIRDEQTAEIELMKGYLEEIEAAEKG